MPQRGYANRPTALGRHAMVASAHPLATLAGIECLRAGGNAVDAALAVNAALAVTQPHMCGLGGDLFCLLSHAASGRVLFLAGAGRSGSRATREHLLGLGLEAIPLVSPLAVSVPGCVDGWTTLHERFASRPLGELLKPAIGLAVEGFPTSDLLAQTIAERLPLIDDPEWRRIYAPGGQPLRPGALLRQPDLARTLALVAERGSEGFYRGEVAEQIVTTLEARGGLLTRQDLEAHASRWEAPIETAYRDYTVYQTSPPTQGLALLLGLNLLEGFELGQLPFHSADHVHLMVECTKLAYADRDRYVADPDAAEVPVAGLLDKAYAARRRALLNPRRARHPVPFGNPAGDTTGFAVADQEGNLIAVIQSLYTPFGAGIVPPGTGITLQARGAYFSLDPAHPNVLAPRKRPFHTLIASLVLRDGAPVLGFATMGSDGQPQTHLQVLTDILDFGLEIQEAIERPRWLQGRFKLGEPTDGLRLEGRFSPRTVAALRRRGHRVEVVSDWYHQMGHAHGVVVRREAEGRLLMGGADPRGDGLALGY